RLVANCRLLLGCFDGEFALSAMQLARKVPRRLENLLDGFTAVVEDDPAFVVTIRAAQPDSVVLRHGCPSQFRPILHGAREHAAKDCGSGGLLFHARCLCRLRRFCSGRSLDRYEKRATARKKVKSAG